jgi:hypothetical protein
MIAYKFRASDMVYDCPVELPDGPTIPKFHTRQAPPEQAGHYAVMRGGWILVEGKKPDEPVPPTPVPTPDDLKMIGVEILGVMCSATRDDQDGLTAVAVGVTMARANGQVFPATKFYFANGNDLVITDENFDAIYSTWVPFRQSFYSPE